ncbi:polysaccharide lyase 8 family protein [Glycomyces tenuis]|uniref:polysaccharide lyase 8 family protein n=1 Tax=Glycomyces tenuis TaxID=58116 RepID=UPI000402952F|nr:polysaccharide lyase 8 family protein [Glycomyces tenuis]
MKQTDAATQTEDRGGPGFSRRGLLLGGATAAGLWAAGVDGTTAHAATPDDFAGVRDRWFHLLTGGEELDPDLPEVRAVLDQMDSQTESRLASMDRSPDRTWLWRDLGFDGNDWSQSIDMRQSFERLRGMALSYAAKGSARRGDPELLEAIVDGMDWMVEHRYYVGAEQIGNWYNWQTGTPRALNPTARLVFDVVDPARIDFWMDSVHYFAPDPRDDGSSLTRSSEIVAQRAALVEDDAKLRQVQTEIVPALQAVEVPDGFFWDGSFLQHMHHPYTGGYGRSLVQSISRSLLLLTGSPWELPATDLADLWAFIEDGFIPWLHKGSLLSAVRGRNIARPSGGHNAGAIAAWSLMWLAHSAEPDRAARLRGVVKYTHENDTYGDLFDTSELGSLTELYRVLDDPDIDPTVPAARNRQYPMMDRVLHKRPDSTFVISMHSSRVYNYEGINKENLRGWHTGSGMQYLHNDDLGHYDDAYWATVDHMRLPGTTVPVGVPEPAEGQSSFSDKDWVGGVGLGSLGVAGMEFRTFSETDQAAAPTGKKSWFMFDDTIVAVGTGITSSLGEPVESIIENRRITGTGQRLVVDGTELGDGEQTVPGAAWAHLEGPNATSGIGYVFGDENTVHVKRGLRTGSWADVNQNGTPDERPIEREYATLWFDHGVDPEGAGYAYTLLPGATPEEVQQYAAEPAVEVVANTPAVQAARRGGTFGANFWTDDAPAVNGITCRGSASVLIEHTGNRLTVAIADPTHLRTEPVLLRIPRAAKSEIEVDDRVTVESLRPHIEIAVDLSGARGGTVVAAFGIAS